MSKIIKISSKDQFDEIIAKNEKVLAAFRATWCGTCQMLKPVLDQLSDKLEKDLIVIDADVDENPELVAKQEIMATPTLLLFEKQNLKWRNTGFVPLAKLEEMVK
ncbi:thioredoxin family protein [Williamsoniiplasma lucivorax]|uniref:Thioredoxin n=1 Tax=Williamsoniiplasma lucivorax TaxID=209274 RepID=A0A2S5R9Y7_9MOLU|nr:thioredoxin family protein [Williamsoniiplasma lucivorax]PPE04144.1 thioredoxin [Williamsoniiplasma lucivorax]